MARSTHDKTGRLTKQLTVKYVIWGMNGVAVARHGPILGENGAVGSRKVFRYLPDLREAI